MRKWRVGPTGVDERTILFWEGDDGHYEEAGRVQMKLAVWVRDACNEKEQTDSELSENQMGPLLRSMVEYARRP